MIYIGRDGDGFIIIGAVTRIISRRRNACEPLTSRVLRSLKRPVARHLITIAHTGRDLVVLW